MITTTRSAWRSLVRSGEVSAREGLPIGVQFVARDGDEAMLSRVTAQIEAARPWCVRKPVVCA